MYVGAAKLAAEDVIRAYAKSNPNFTSVILRCVDTLHMTKKLRILCLCNGSHIGMLLTLCVCVCRYFNVYGSDPQGRLGG